MANVARSISGVVGRVVVDKTGLRGVWNVELEFAPDLTPNATSGAPLTDAPSLFAAVQEQLGLRLQPARGAVEVLVIDHIDAPTED
jgi:uncharacterized protein (TIGR03435 family)